MTVRRSTLLGAAVGTMGVLMAVLFIHAAYRVSRDHEQLTRTGALAGELGLSDLCLFTEASYTRHLSLADRHTPFQELPFSFEHFPTGALAAPPAHLTESHVPHD